MGENGKVKQQLQVMLTFENESDLRSNLQGVIDNLHQHLAARHESTYQPIVGTIDVSWRVTPIREREGFDF